MDTQEPSQDQKVQTIVDRTLFVLKKEYVLAGTTRGKSWHAWLIIGLVAGAAAGVILVANRSGQLESSSAKIGGVSAMVSVTTQ